MVWLAVAIIGWPVGSMLSRSVRMMNAPRRSDVRLFIALSAPSVRRGEYLRLAGRHLPDSSQAQGGGGLKGFIKPLLKRPSITKPLDRPFGI